METPPPPAAVESLHPRYVYAGELAEFIWRTFHVNLSPDALLSYRHESAFHAHPWTEEQVKTWWTTSGVSIHRRRRAAQAHRALSSENASEVKASPSAQL